MNVMSVVPQRKGGEDMEQMINCQNWTAQNFQELFTMLKENKGVKVILTFEQQESKMKHSNSEKVLGMYLARLGFSAHLNGYSYIKTAIKHCINNPEEMESVTKLLYPAIAREHNTTAGKVEHSIRHAITLAWKKENKKEWETIFGYRMEFYAHKPTNSEFLATLTDYIQYND